MGYKYKNKSYLNEINEETGISHEKTKSKPEQSTDVEKLAKDHWVYNHGLILRMLSITEYAYRQAFTHGVKHGRDMAKGEN